jgi:hypothetical protein
MIAFGDVVERCLRFVGITKERVASMSGLGDCGCGKRQERLNEAGYAFQAWLESLCHRLRYFSADAAKNRTVARLIMFANRVRMACRVLFYGG